MRFIVITLLNYFLHLFYFHIFHIQNYQSECWSECCTPYPIQHCWTALLSARRHQTTQYQKIRHIGHKGVFSARFCLHKGTAVVFTRHSLHRSGAAEASGASGFQLRFLVPNTYRCFCTHYTEPTVGRPAGLIPPTKQQVMASGQQLAVTVVEMQVIEHLISSVAWEIFCLFVPFFYKLYYNLFWKSSPFLNTAVNNGRTCHLSDYNATFMLA